MRSGSAKLNIAISENSWHHTGQKTVWQAGVTGEISKVVGDSVESKRIDVQGVARWSASSHQLWRLLDISRFNSAIEARETPAIRRRRLWFSMVRTEGVDKLYDSGEAREQHARLCEPHPRA